MTLTHMALMLGLGSFLYFSRNFSAKKSTMTLSNDRPPSVRSDTADFTISLPWMNATYGTWTGTGRGSGVNTDIKRMQRLK